MGAWGAGPFDNDDACDWAYDLPKGRVKYIRNTLQAVTNARADEYVEAPECSSAIAAAEAVAAMHGKGLKKLPEDVDAWVATKPKPDAELKSLAVAALERIGSSSELKELWDEGGPDSENAKQWYGHLEDLKSRLR
jgi:hypothetical protein